MSPAQLRARIDALEAASDVKAAISDVESTEFAPHESGTVDLHVSCNTTNLGITFVNGLPPAVLIAGLRAMERELERMADVREVA
jgi:hypothetical protein